MRAALQLQIRNRLSTAAAQRGPSDPRPKQPKLRQSAQSLLWSSPCTTEVLTFTLTLTLTLALTLTLTLRTV